MKLHIFLMSLFLVLLSACSQESAQIQAPIQVTSQVQSWWIVPITTKESQATGTMLVQKNEVKKAEIQIPISADDCMKYIETIAQTGENTSWSANNKFNDCMARSAMESSEISFCMEHEFPNEAWVQLCVESMLRHLIEKNIEKNWWAYPVNFCRDIVKRVRTPETMWGAGIGNEHKLWNTNYIHACYVTYASISNNIAMCQWTETNRYTMELTFDPNISIDQMSVDSCITSFVSKHKNLYTKDQFCSLLSSNQSKNCKGASNITFAIQSAYPWDFYNLLNSTDSVPSHSQILKKISEAEQSLKQKKGKDSQYNDLLK